MKLSSVSLLVPLVVFLPASVAAQSVLPDPITRPRTVTRAAGSTSKTYQTQATQEQVPSDNSGNVSSAANRSRQASEDQTAASPSLEEPVASRRLTPSRIHTRITEAERLLKSRAVPIAITAPPLDYVTVAALLAESSQIHLIRIAKQNFLTKGTVLSLTTSLGLPVEVHVLRANGVNTAVTIFDNQNHTLAPLVVEFPIERFGRFREMAYYTSAHPALLSSDLTKAGQAYVNSMVDLAAKRVRDRGVPIAQNIVEVAKHLCIVEHVDHDRFRNENRIALFDEIYSLYALNELDTYRYSVSSAGAGGMVQMIPWAYQLERQRHPAVGLNPDFIAGCFALRFKALSTILAFTLSREPGKNKRRVCGNVHEDLNAKTDRPDTRNNRIARSVYRSQQGAKRDAAGLVIPDDCCCRAGKDSRASGEKHQGPQWHAGVTTDSGNEFFRRVNGTAMQFLSRE